jgi:hypothetical protein
MKALSPKPSRPFMKAQLYLAFVELFIFVISGAGQS